jgi:dCMP deaminase
MDIARRTAELSSARRLQVGAIVVKDDRIISIGYNGMPAGWDNNCEHEIGTELKTKPEVLHAEMNALMKLAKSNESGLDSSVFVTHAPCLDCAKGIYQAGIREVYYESDYRDSSGVEFLNKCGVTVEKI